ncbi:MAG: toxin TcdB middle/C-terminal domain-containing protein [Bacteroidota bacterium]
MTKLRFPVQVVEQVTIADKISGSKLVSRYKYHDGYYNTVERMFRGFGFVESWDTETFEKYEEDIPPDQFPSGRLNKELFVPPTYTKTWYHTGTYLANKVISRQYRGWYYKGDKEAYDFPDSFFEPEIFNDDQTLRHAYSSLNGQVLRREVYAADDKHESADPYSVEEFNFEVRLIQPRKDNESPVVMVSTRENIFYHYERNPKDPRVQQEFTFEVDRHCGEVKKSCSVSLPRRKPGNSGEKVYPEQQSIKAIAQKNHYINTSDELPYRWRGILCDAKQFEIYNLDLKGKAYFSYEEAGSQVNKAFEKIIPYQSLLMATGLQAMQLTRNRLYYWNEEQSGHLKLSEINARGLIHHEETAVFTKEFINTAFNNKLSDPTISNEGGYYYCEESGYYWNRGLIQYYFTSANPACFYLPYSAANGFADPSSSLFTKTDIEYEEQYCMLPISKKYYLDSNTINQESFSIDQQTRQYKQLVDINKNVSQVLFDPLGMVIVSTLFGTENGMVKGGMRLYEYGGQAAEYTGRFTSRSGGLITFEDVLNKDNREYYLQGATTYFFYNLLAWKDSQHQVNPQPPGAISLTRENYFREEGLEPAFSCQVLIEYADGFARGIETKQLTSPGIAILIDAEGKLIRGENNKVVRGQTDERWIVSGRTVYNNKGKPCEEYLPYFSNTPLYETQTEIVSEKLVAPPAITHYDPLQRIIRVDTPKGFFTKVEFTPWVQKYFDEDDTVLHSPFYKENYPKKLSVPEKEALDKAAAFFDTPTINVTDNAGNVFLCIQADIEMRSCGRELTTHYTLDILGRIIESVDPRLYCANQSSNNKYYNFRYRYAMGEEDPLYTDSADAGIQTHFSNIFDNQLLSWSARNYCQYITYDKLQRQKTLQVKKEDPSPIITPMEGFNLVEVFTYGEEIDDPEKNNLRGRLHQLNNLSGITIMGQYDLQGETTRLSKQVVKEYKTAVNWNGEVKLDEKLDFTYRFNALKLLLTEQTPDGSITSRIYNESGSLFSLAVMYSGDPNLHPVINNISYDAQMQRTEVSYANGISTQYTYEKTTLRLLSLFSKRKGPNRVKKPADNTTVQNISYTYDPVGNIMSVVDETCKTVFNNNSEVKPLLSYSYDAFYRLTEATGRQHPGITINTYKNNKTDNSFKQSKFSLLSPANDGDKLENYKESYAYDDAGNLVKYKHTADSASWTREIPQLVVMDNSNRLKDITYDESGNMRQLDINNPVNLSFNCCENLVKADIIIRPDELNDADYYVYDAGEQRTRKVCERWVQGETVTLIEEKTYLGNFEIKKIRSINSTGTETTKLLRNTLRIMDDSSCVAIMHYWITDDTNREAEKEGKRQLRYQMDNNLGSVSLEMDSEAKLISYEEYFPYGGTAIIAGDSEIEVKRKDYRYSGKECDDSTGLYYYGARYYCPWLGRWLNPDPAGTVDGLNLYAFVNGNPITYTDEDGLSKKKQNKIKLKGIGKGTHKKLNSRFMTIGQKLRLQLKPGLLIKPLTKNPAGHQSDFLNKILADLSLLQASKRFGVFYRNIQDAQDELVSTSSVREFVKGVLDKKGGALTSAEKSTFNEALNYISRVRFPTKWSGFAAKGGAGGADRMQHPTSPGLGIWRAFIVSKDGNPHSELDRRRKEEVINAMEAATKSGSNLEQVLKAGIIRAITFTLNEFTAPATAKDQAPEATISKAERTKQTMAREGLKKLAIDIGAVQEKSKDESLGRNWGDRTGLLVLSPRRQ